MKERKNRVWYSLFNMIFPTKGFSQLAHHKWINRRVIQAENSPRKEDIANKILALERPLSNQSALTGWGNLFASSIRYLVSQALLTLKSPSVRSPSFFLSWERFPISEHPAHRIVGSSGRPVGLFFWAFGFGSYRFFACDWLIALMVGQQQSASIGECGSYDYSIDQHKLREEDFSR